MPESSKPIWLGKLLGKYRLVEPLGRGGMAEVFKAFQSNLDRYVAVKVIHPHLVAEDPSFIPRFEAEAKTVASLRHPHIVQIHDFDAEGDVSYMVMELIEGVTLRRYLETLSQSREPLPLRETARIITEIGQALAYAHWRGMIHRDVKPANVMVDTGGAQPRMILTDFGLAKLLSGSGQTATGSMIGTPAYMSPEQGAGRAVDARADQYALGVMLYEMTTGRLPFQADTAVAMALKHITEPLPAPRAVNAALPETLERVIITCLAKEPDDRFPTVEAMLDALNSAVRGEGSLPRVPIAPSPNEAPTREGQWTPLILPTPAHPEEATDVLTAPGPGQKTTLAHIEIPPPPEPALPPRLDGFVGRTAELAYFADKLAQSHLAVITGMAGIGKTALASALAARQPDPVKIFWHAFHAGESVEVLLWKLAGFLAWRRKPDVWQTLQAAQSVGSPPPPPEVLLDYLFQHLRGGDFVLGLDDFQRVEGDPLLDQFGERLLAATRAGEVSAIIATQRLPSFVASAEYKSLTGLTLADTALMATERGLTLTPALTAQLHARTGGNPQLLALASEPLRKGKDPARLLERLAESESIERFLMNEVDKGLTEDERAVMTAAAVLGEPGTRAALEAVLDGISVRRTLNDLCARHLLTLAEADDGKEYSPNALVQAFYYDALGKKERQTLHQRAANFYESDEPAPLRAARHRHAAGDAVRAAQIILADVWALLNAGHARGLRAVLEQFSERQVNTEQWMRLLLARGQVSALLGETETAQHSYTAAHTRAATGALRAQACLGLGELLQTEAPTEALSWLRRGLNETPSILSGTERSEVKSKDAPSLEAALRIRMGRILAYQGQLAEAETELHAGLALLPPDPTRLRLSALGNLGNLASARGEAAQAQAHYAQVAGGARLLNDWWLMAEALINLGIELDAAGRWAESALYYQQALEQAERLGSLNQTQRALMGLGNLAVKQGDDPAAKSHLRHALELARAQGWQAEQVYASISLAGAEVQSAEPNLAEADSLLSEAERLAQIAEVREPLPELYYRWAEVRLAQARPAEAMAFAEKALALAVELNAETYRGVALRVLGQARWANGQRESAIESFTQSVAVLDKHDAYEAERARTAWSQRVNE